MRLMSFPYITNSFYKQRLTEQDKFISSGMYLLKQFLNILTEQKNTSEVWGPLPLLEPWS
jgi:hypothetical protein